MIVLFLFLVPLAIVGLALWGASGPEQERARAAAQLPARNVALPLIPVPPSQHVSEAKPAAPAAAAVLRFCVYCASPFAEGSLRCDRCGAVRREA